MADKRSRNTGRTNSRNYSGNKRGQSNRKRKKKSGSRLPAIFILILALAAAAAVFAVKTKNDADKAFAANERSFAVFTKRGDVTVTYVEDFDKDYYDSDELKQYVDSELASYNAGGKKVTLKKLQISEGKARLVMHYDSVLDYVDFNAQDMAYETLENAENEGYDFSKLSGKTDLKDDTRTFGEGTANELKNAKVIIITEPMDVTAPYDILFCSDNMSVKSSREAEYIGDISESEPGILVLEK